MINEDYPYCEYKLPSGNSVILTPRPDSYCPEGVAVVLQKCQPRVRFQLTDDHIDWVGIPFHWYPWIPGRNLPIELVFPAITLLIEYTKTPGTIWMHCDSSSMRAPTFFGLFLHVAYPGRLDEICEPAWWTRDREYRRHSDPRRYADVSMEKDPGIKEMVEIWVKEGAKAAHSHVTRLV